MAEEGGPGGYRDEDFPERLMRKAEKIQSLAVSTRAEELNNHDIALCANPNDHSDKPAMTSGKQYLEPDTPEWAVLTKRFEWIPAAFMPFAKLPDPADFSQPSGAMDLTIRKLGKPVERDGKVTFADSAMGGVDAVAHHLASWTGDAKDAWTEFTKIWPTIIVNQAAIAGSLKFAAEAHGQIYWKARGDIEAIADSTIKALQAVDDGDLSDAKTLITVVDALASAAALLGPIPKAISLTLIITKTAVSLDQPKPQIKLGAPDVNGVLDKMLDAINQFRDDLYDQEHDLDVMLTQNFREIIAKENAAVICPKGPEPLTHLRGSRIEDDMTPV